MNCCQLFGGFFHLLHDREHEDSGDKANTDEYAPNDPQWNIAPQFTADTYKVIADSGSNEPTAHHHSFVFRRSHFADERDTHRAEE